MPRLALVLLLLLAVPGPASAATARVVVEVDSGGTPISVVRFDGDPGERNDVSVRGEAGAIVLHDRRASLGAGARCTARDAHTVACEAPRDRSSFIARLHDGDDRLAIEERMEVGLGPVVRGGRGDDGLWGGPGGESLDGGPGADMLSGGAGADSLDGGLGDDTLDGGAGEDSLSYERRTPVIVDLAAGTGGGAGAERDALSGLERVWTGSGDDVVRGTAAPEHLSTGRGDDVIAGRGGADRVFAYEGDDTVGGGRGDDRLIGGDGHDSMAGGEGDDTLDGGRDPDLLMGGAGDDSLDPEHISDRGAGADVLRCGRGTDTLTVWARERLRMPPACEGAIFDLIDLDYALAGRSLVLRLRFFDRHSLPCRLRVGTAAGRAAAVFRRGSLNRTVEVTAPAGRVRLRIEAGRPCRNFDDGEGITVVFPRPRTR